MPGSCSSGLRSRPSAAAGIRRSKGFSARIWTTLRRGSILTVEHRFPEDLRDLERHGRFNVGVLGWRRDSNGLGCLRWWRERCLEWCHDRLEDGKYADQGYLDAWPERFAGVVVAEHPGINLAPWNWRSHVVRVTGDSLEVDGWPLVVYHFAALKALGNGRWNTWQLDYGVMPLSMIHVIYGPYLSALMAQSQTERGSATVRNRFAWRRRVWLYLFGAIWRRAWNGELTVEGGWLPGASSGRWLARWRREAK